MTRYKFSELVSKVIVEGSADDSIVQSILGWLKSAKPTVIVNLKEKKK